MCRLFLKIHTKPKKNGTAVNTNNSDAPTASTSFLISACEKKEWNGSKMRILKSFISSKFLVWFETGFRMNWSFKTEIFKSKYKSISAWHSQSICKLYNLVKIYIKIDGQLIGQTVEPDCLCSFVTLVMHL